jgi:AraC-like DNA-binding protein
MARVLPAIMATLASKGIDVDAVFAQANLSIGPAGSPLDRVPISAVAQAWTAAVRATGEPLLGLDVARHLRPASFHALGLSLQASNSLRDFGVRISRYFGFVTQGSVLSFIERDGDVVIAGRVRFGSIPPESEDAFTLFLVDFVADLSDGVCRPHAIAMMREEPADGGERHRSEFACPVEFASGALEIRYPHTLADVSFRGASEELTEVNDRVVIAYLAKLDRSDIEARVRSQVIDDLPSGRVSKTRVASRLNMSPRTLQNKLNERGTTFQSLVDETRRALANAYLEDRSRPLAEVAYLLGFSSPSNLSRAFKRWNGSAPGGARRTGAK